MKKIKLMLAMCFSVVLYQAVAMAQASKQIHHTQPSGLQLSALSDQDLSVLVSGAACWLENSQADILLYDDLGNAVVKVGTQVIKLNKKKGNWDSGFYSCGQTYEYISEDKQTQVSVKMKTRKKSECEGSIAVKSSLGNSVTQKLVNRCGA